MRGVTVHLVRGVTVHLVRGVTVHLVWDKWDTCKESLKLVHALCARSSEQQTSREYSEISDSGRSEIRTISLQRTQLEVPRYNLPVVPIHFGTLKEDNLLTKDKKTVPKCPLFRDTTLYSGTIGR